MNTLERITQRLAKNLYWVAGAAIIIMMMLTCADVVLRYFRRPIPGTYELVCFLGSVSVAFAMAYTTIEKGHVSVSFVVDLFPQKIQDIIACLTTSFGLCLFVFVTWQSMVYANDLRLSNEVSLTLELPFYPFVYGIGFSAAIVCLILLCDLMNHLKKIFDK
ncbi:MAG: TRAP transporter small permease [Deltaproteobacteria bacterium]|nr:TRAP transporter small permease [Deltaproteobacteria bacterium]